jgi:hypothetical protein
VGEGALLSHPSQKGDYMSIETFLSQAKRGELIDERRGLLPEDRDFHYLMSEMVEPLIGSVITGGVVIGNGSPEEPHVPVLFVMQNGRKYSVIISSDDEINDGGRILIERGTDAYSVAAQKGVEA